MKTVFKYKQLQRSYQRLPKTLHIIRQFGSSQVLGVIKHSSFEAEEQGMLLSRGQVNKVAN
jgi:hypothetical protein